MFINTKKVVIRIPEYECNVISEYDVGIWKSGDTAGSEEVQINNYEIESVLFEVLSLKTKTILVDIVHQTPIFNPSFQKYVNVFMWNYSLGHNILELYNVSVQIQLATSKGKCGI